MKIDGAIFDLDGTLMDSMFIWDTIGSDYLLSRGITPHENLNETFKNMSLYQAALYYQAEYGLTDSAETIIDGVNRMIEYIYRNQVLAKSGTFTFLEQLKKRHIKMCVATSTDRHLAEITLENNKILSYFDEIFTCGDIGHGKDEPNIFHAAHDFLKTPLESTWIFEDALYAVRTAKASGMPVVGVYDKSEKNLQSVSSLADIFIHSFDEMEVYLNE